MVLNVQDMQKYLTEIKSVKWLQVLVALQRAANENGKCKVVRTSVIVNDEGHPIFWSEPSCTKIVPTRSSMDWLDLL